MTAGFRWTPKRLATVSVSYRYERDPEQYEDPYVYESPDYEDQSREQVTLSGQWPVTGKWYLMGRYDYSLAEKRNTQSIVGVEYRSEEHTSELQSLMRISY